MTGANTARICVPVCARRADELPVAIARAAEVSDFIEVRFDCLDASHLETALDLLAADGYRRPYIFTFRPAEEGGRSAPSVRERMSFWESLTERRQRGEFNQPVWADIELGLCETWLEAGGAEFVRKLPVICSHHDFEGVSADLGQVFERMLRTRARTLKVAVRATDITDCIEVFKLLERAKAAGREMIAVAMSEAGLLTRVLGPARGAFLTFGSLDEGHATAPGQLGATELRRLYRIDSISERTLVTGLVGRPVAHSVSPHMHNAAFAARGADAVYLPLEVGDVDAFARRMAHPRTREFVWNLRGFSVTAPHKTSIMRHLDWIEPSAQEIGAVNTVVVEGVELHGYNTDAGAVLVPLREFGALGGARVAVLGAGGAARSLLWSLREQEAQAVLFARDATRARATAEDFGAELLPLDGARFDGFDVVVNTTPLGTRGEREDATPATAAQLRGARVAYDLVYNPAETLFMREARVAGCETFGGLPMLVAQAAEQFKLWMGEDAPLDVMSAAAAKALAS